MDVLLFPFGFSTKILSLALSYVQSDKFLTEEINPAPVEDFALTDGGAFSFNGRWMPKGFSIKARLAELQRNSQNAIQ